MSHSGLPCAQMKFIRCCYMKQDVFSNRFISNYICVNVTHYARKTTLIYCLECLCRPKMEFSGLSKTGTSGTFHGNIICIQKTINAVLFILPLCILLLTVLFVIIGCQACSLSYIDLLQVTIPRHLLLYLQNDSYTYKCVRLHPLLDTLPKPTVT